MGYARAGSSPAFPIPDTDLETIKGNERVLKIEQKHLDTCELQLVIEVEPDRVEQAKRIAARSLAKGVNIPGFRKG